MRKEVAGILLTVGILLALSGVTTWLDNRDRRNDLIMWVKSRSIDRPDDIFWVSRNEYGVILSDHFYRIAPINRSVRYFQAGQEL